MSLLAYAANAYWKAARSVRSGMPSGENIEDLVLILRNLEYPDSLYRGAADAMDKALDLGVMPILSEDEERDLKYALDARDEMEEDRWSALPHSMQDAEPEVLYLSEARAVRNG